MQKDKQTDLLEKTPEIRRIPSDSVFLGPEVASYRRFLYGAFSGEVLVTWAATAGEARRKYGKERSRRQINRARERGYYNY
jgi:hypothetical protein